MKRLRSNAVVKPTSYHYQKLFFFPAASNKSIEKEKEEVW